MPKYKVRFNSGDGIIKIKIMDDTGARTDEFTCNMSDRKHIAFVGRILKDKYGIQFNYSEEENKGFFDY
jgi:hypothetical protein